MTTRLPTVGSLARKYDWSENKTRRELDALNCPRNVKGFRRPTPQIERRLDRRNKPVD